MALNIDDEKNVIDIKRGRGRPKGSLNKAKAAADKAEAMLGKVKDGVIAEDYIKDGRTAPSPSHNEPDVGVFLKHVQQAQEDASELKRLAELVKDAKKLKKTHRLQAQEAGIVLGDLDYALELAETEDVDIPAQFKRRALYLEWLGKDVGYQSELVPSISETEQWFKRGDQAARLGKNRDDYPEGIPPERKTDFCAGWDAGHKVARNGAAKTDSARAAATLPEPASDTLILREEHFEGGIELKKANRSTLFDEATVEMFDKARNVVAIFGASKRILKEMNDDGSVYIDDGAPNTPLTNAQPVAAELLQ